MNGCDFDDTWFEDNFRQDEEERESAAAEMGDSGGESADGRRDLLRGLFDSILDTDKKLKFHISETRCGAPAEIDAR
jgi:hypothetical protein